MEDHPQASGRDVRCQCELIIDMAVPQGPQDLTVSQAGWMNSSINTRTSLFIVYFIALHLCIKLYMHVYTYILDY